MKCNTCANTHVHRHKQNRQRYYRLTTMFTKACKKLGLKKKKKKIKKIKKRNESISQPAEKGRQTPLSSACTVGATWFIPWDSWKLKSSLFKLVPWQKRSNSLMSQITLTSKAPPSHLAFLALRMQRTNIILFHVCLWGCRAQCGYLHKELQNQAKFLVSVMPLSYCFTFILFST